MFTYSHANTPLSQSERAYYLSYFIITKSFQVDWLENGLDKCLFFCLNFRALDTSNESQTLKRGLEGEHPKISLGSMSPFLPRLGNWLVFILDP